MDELSLYYNKILYEYADPRSIQYIMVGSPLPVTIVLIAYWLLVKKIGPAHMKNRPSYDLKLTIQIYNLLQVAMNAFLVVWGMRIMIQKGEYRCMFNNSNSPIDLAAVYIHWVYLMIKLLDLLDTVFFVLRKKFNLISTLHTYHHTTTVISAYLIFRYYPGGESLILGVLNSFVHTLMYSYYFYCLYNKNQQDIWWKKYITQLQMVQFCILFVWYTSKFFMHGCGYPKLIVFFFGSHSVVLLKMFGSYYYNAFIKQKNVGNDVGNDNSKGLQENESKKSL